MSYDNWPIIIGICITGGLIIGGLVFVALQWRFQNPKKRVNIANLYTDANIKMLRSERKKEYKELEQKCLRHANRLEELENRLRETRLAVKLTAKSLNEAVPIFLEISKDEVRTRALTNSLQVVQRILDRP